MKRLAVNVSSQMFNSTLLYYHWLTELGVWVQSIAEKLQAEHDQRQKTTLPGISRHNSTSSVQSAASIEVAEITKTALSAQAQIAELASHSTEEDARQQSSPQPSNHRRHNDGGDAGENVSTPDGNIRHVAPFITITRGEFVIYQSFFINFWVYQTSTLWGKKNCTVLFLL